MEPSAEVRLFEFQIDNEASGYLSETARWAKFMAIVGFVAAGILVLVIIFGSNGNNSATRVENLDGSFTYSNYNPVLTKGFLFIIALIYFFPSLFMLRYAAKMRTALRHDDQLLLNQSLRNLRLWFRFVGILIIVTIALALVGIIITFLNARSQ